jgi:hypothetical protein
LRSMGVFGSDWREAAVLFVTYPWGEAAALSLSKGMRRGQNSPVDKLLERLGRETWNEGKAPCSAKT